MADQMKAMTRKQKTLEVLYDDGKPIGSKWTILSLDQLNFHIDRIKEQRASTLIELQKYKNSKVGLVNIQNICYDACWKGVCSIIRAKWWQNDARLTVLKQMQ